MRPRHLSHITAQALVPEQVLSYVTAVAGSRALLCGDCAAYENNGHLVLVAYKPGLEPETGDAALATMNRAVDEALALDPASLTVLGPGRTTAAPDDAAFRADAYWAIPLPAPAPGQKLRNMLRRAERECRIREESWIDEHTALVARYLETRPLETGTRHIYLRIPDYLAATPDAALFAARARADGRLLGFSIGDFSSLSTAMYMFAFRAGTCPPGVADALLLALAGAGTARGHQRLNLGLGINDGIVFFKRKWRASPFLPCVQTTWKPKAQPATPSRILRSVHGHDAPGGTPLSPAASDPLAAVHPPSFRENLSRFLSGGKREFECIQVEVTSHCPGRCTYCPHTTKRHVWRSRHMADTTFAALAPLLLRTNRVHLQGWGEPLLHPRFLDFTAAARRAGCAVSFTTYGLAMTDVLATKLVRSGIDIVAFSLTGTDETSNADRDKVPFAGVVEAIGRLNRAKKTAESETPQIRFAYLMLASRMKAVEKLPELMRRLDVPVSVVSTLDYLPEPGAADEAFAPDDAAKIEKARAALQEAAARAHGLGLAIHYSLPGPNGRCDCSEHIRNCMYVDAEGQISPCIYVNLPTDEEDPRRRVYGRVTERDPLGIWRDPDFAVFRKRLAACDPDLPCRSCPKRFERLF